MSITRSHIDHMLAMFCPSHDQDVAPKGNAPWHVNRHGKVDVEVRVRLKEDLELVMVGTFHNGCIAVVDVWLNVVLVEVVAATACSSRSSPIDALRSGSGL